MSDPDFIDAIKIASLYLDGARPSKNKYELVRVKHSLLIPHARSFVKKRTWREWLSLAGFDVSDLNIQAEVVMSEEQILDSLSSLYLKLNTPLNLVLVKTHTLINPLRLSRRFGGLRKACELRGIPVESKAVHNRPGKKGKLFSKSEILSKLKQIHEIEKVPLDTYLVSKHLDLNRNILAKRFGSLAQACEQAGIPSSDHSNKASRLLDRVEQLLDIRIQREVTFDWLRNPKTDRPLRFDGFLQEHNIAIEIDGQSHTDSGYYIRLFNRSLQDFKDMQERDSFKNRQSKIYGVVLLRFTYPNTAKHLTTTIQQAIRSLSS